MCEYYRNGQQSTGLEKKDKLLFFEIMIDVSFEPNFRKFKSSLRKAKLIKGGDNTTITLKKLPESNQN